MMIVFFTLSTSSTAHAYWWRLSNFTTKTLLLKLKLAASNNPYYVIVLPNDSALFDWSPPSPLAGFCFEKLEWMEVSQTLLHNRELIDENYIVLSNKKIDLFLSQNQEEYQLKNAPLRYFGSELYKRTVQAASRLGPKKFILWLAKLHAQSVCKSRHIAIVENINGGIEFFTQKS